MGLIREPEGVDFIVESHPMIPEEANEIAEWITARRNDPEQKEAAGSALETIRRNRSGCSPRLLDPVPSGNISDPLTE